MKVQSSGVGQGVFPAPPHLSTLQMATSQQEAALVSLPPRDCVCSFLLHLAEVVSMLLDSSPEVVTVCVRPLVLACQLGRMEMVEILLEAGMDPNMVDDRSGTSPLHEAMRFYREDIAKLLLSFGANPDSENRQNEVGGGG